MEPASGESCPPGRRRRPAAPGEDTVLSPDEKSLHTPTTPTTQGRKQRSPESIPPLTVLKTQPHWLIADWLGLMEPARGESSPSGQRRSPAAPGEDNFPSLDQNLSLSLQLQQTGDENADPRGQYRPSRCGNLNTTGWLLIGWGSWSQHAARASPRDNIEVPPHPGMIGSHPRIRNPSISLQLNPTTWGRKRTSPGPIPPRTVWKPQPHWLVAN